jgi:hypothetical protein
VALREVVDGLAESGRALVVGHSPTKEAAALGPAGEVIALLGKGDGVVLPRAPGATAWSGWTRCGVPLAPGSEHRSGVTSMAGGARS